MTQITYITYLSCWRVGCHFWCLSPLIHCISYTCVWVCLPWQALSEHEEAVSDLRSSSHHVWRACVSLLGIYVFFNAERILGAITSIKRDKKKQQKNPDVSHGGLTVPSCMSLQWKSASLQTIFHDRCIVIKNNVFSIMYRYLKTPSGNKRTAGHIRLFGQWNWTRLKCFLKTRQRAGYEISCLHIL